MTPKLNKMKLYNKNMTERIFPELVKMGTSSKQGFTDFILDGREIEEQLLAELLGLDEADN